LAFLSELHALRIDLLHQQGLDTTTPAGKAMFQMLGEFAEFERSIIAERVRAGLSRARVRESGSAEGAALDKPAVLRTFDLLETPNRIMQRSLHRREPVHHVSLKLPALTFFCLRDVIAVVMTHRTPSHLPPSQRKGASQ
jgi:hypothetical protein